MQKIRLPNHDDLLLLTDKCISILENEDCSYREQSGGLLDFTNKEKKPLIIIPDLHGRWYFIDDLLKLNLKNTKACVPYTVKDALEKGVIRVVCLGDIFHSEAREKKRWFTSYAKFKKGNYTSRAMKYEMGENLTLLTMILKLKTKYPECFHILKGNHENILNVNDGGDHAFYKYADEGNMVKAFMHIYYGDALPHLISCFEHALPVAACFENCVVSHAEPVCTFTREQIIKKSPDVIEGLTWTCNGQAQNGSVYHTMINLIGNENTQSAKWFTGHRAIKNDFAFRQNGKLVQIHNPSQENVVILGKSSVFNAETDIIHLK